MSTLRNRALPLLAALVTLTGAAQDAAAAPSDTLNALRGNRVVLTLTSGRTLRGRLVQVGPKAVVLSREYGAPLVIPGTQIARVRAVLAAEHRSWIRRPRLTLSKDSGRAARATATWKVGMGITLAGLSVVGVSAIVGVAAAFCGFDGFNFAATVDDYDTSEPSDCKPKRGAAWAVFGVGLTMASIGTATWVVGAVRRSLAHDDPHRESRRKAWRNAGIGVTLVGGALSVAGVALLTTPGIPTDSAKVGGGITLGFGLYTALAVGLPMWIEAWRHRPGQKASATGSATGTNRQTLDPGHEQDRQSRLALGNPRATVFSTAFQF